MSEQFTLLVDIGNSAVKWCTLSADDQLSSMEHHYYPINSSALKFFNELWVDLAKPKKIIVACVAKNNVWQALQQSCEDLWSLDVERMGSPKKACGLTNAYEDVERLGSDRWFAMLGAFNEQATATSSLVVGCGSAITLDIIDSEGLHQGGYILPGLAMMKRSLVVDTANVSVDSELSNPSLLPATTTAGCVDAGILLSAVKLIEAVFEEQSLHNNVRCYLSGGDATLIADLLSIKYVIMPNLVLRGLAHFISSDEYDG